MAELPKTKLQSADQLELTQFVQKQAWIEEKIKFLSALPPVNALSPDPPSLSATTKTNLDAWWEEHDRIEQEVDAYDMGDLTKLKQFAKNASKAHLSSRDADLIEITLTTLFAVDRLLQLLRNRRKALTLLQYRLQWEEQVTAAWTGHEGLLAELPSFLAKARWQRPPALPISLSASTSSLSSSTSRPVRVEVLSLEQARLKSRLHTLTSTLVPTSAATLDQLIDLSSSPLPDAFLDEQDRLEEKTKKLTDDLDNFLAGIVKQWQASDDISARLGRLTSTIARLDKDVDAAIAVLPQRANLEDLEKRQRAAREELESAVERVRRSIPMPTHSAAPDQAEDSRSLVESFEEDVRTTAATLGEAEARVASYRGSVEVVERAAEVKKQLDEACTTLVRFAEEEAALEGRPDLCDERCLIISTSEPSFDSQYSALASYVAPLLSSASSPLRDASTIIIDLGKTKIDANVRRDVKDCVERLQEAHFVAAERLRVRGEEKKAVVAARELAAALEQAVTRTDSTIGRLKDAISTSNWSSASSPRPAHQSSVVDLRDELDALLTAPLAHGKALLSAQYPPLHAYLQRQASRVRSSYLHLNRLDQVATSLGRQAIKVDSLLSDIHQVDSSLSSLADELLARLAAAQIEQPQSSRQRWIDQHAALAARLKSLKDAAHTRIPFFASSSTSSTTSDLPSCLASLPSASPLDLSLPVDLSAQDESIRSAVNQAITATAGRLDDVQHLFDLLEHQHRALEWDQTQQTVEDELAELEKGASATQGTFDSRTDDAEADVLAPIAQALAHLSDQIPTASGASTSLATSLNVLVSSPFSSDPRFQSHRARQDVLDRLSTRHIAVTAQLDALRQSLKKSRLARQQREVEDEKREENKAATLAEWRTRLAEAVAELETSLKTAQDSDAELSVRVRDATASRLARQEARRQLLLSQDLRADSDVDHPLPLQVELGEHQPSVSALASSLQRHASLLATLDEDLSWLSDAEDETSHAHELLNHLRWSIESFKRRAKLRAQEVEQGKTDDEAWARERESILESRRRQLVEEQEAASQARQEEEQRLAVRRRQEEEERPQHERMAEEAARREQEVGSRPELEFVETAPLSTLNGAHLPLERRAAAEQDGLRKRSSPAPFPFDPFDSSDDPTVKALRDQVDAVVVDVWLDTTAVLHFPSLAEVNDLRQDLSTLGAELELASTAGDLGVEMGPVKEELERKTAVLDKVGSLAQFGDRLATADASLSSLLNALDASDLAFAPPDDDDPFGPPPPPSRSVADALAEATEAVEAARQTASLMDDGRVVKSVKRITETHQALTEMARDLSPPAPSSRPPPFALPSQAWSTSRTQPRPSSCLSSSRTSSRAPTLSSSRPPSSRDTPSRQSTASLQTPSRRASALLSPTPRRRTSSAASPSTPRQAPTVPRGFSFSSTSNRVPRSDLSRSTSAIPHSASRGVSVAPPTPSATARRALETPRRRESLASSTSTRRASSVASPQATTKKRQYKVNPHRKVDVEIGRIVNELDIHVPISAAEGATRQEDESGMYWIGDRMYFIRVLRSKACLVRVGGGWEPLQTFIINRFGSSSGVTISPRISPSTSLQSHDPHWIRSNSLSQSQSSTSSLANLLSASASSSFLSTSASGSTPFGRRVASGGSSKSSLRRSISGLPPPSHLPSSSATPRAPITLPQWRP